MRYKPAPCLFIVEVNTSLNVPILLLLHKSRTLQLPLKPNCFNCKLILAGVASSDELNSATYLSPVFGSSATQQTASPSLNNSLLFLLFLRMASTSLLFNNDKVNGSLSGRLPPNIKGDRNMHHKDIKVYCSSLVKAVMRGSPRSARIPIRP